MSKILLLIVTQTSKPFHGLTKDTKSIPREGIVDEVPMIQKSTLKNSLRKQRPWGTVGKNDVVYPVSPASHKGAKLPDPLICVSRQVLPEWDFSST